MGFDVAAHRHALGLALAEKLCPSLNGSTSHRLAEVIDVGALDDSSLAADDQDWLVEGLHNVTEERVRHWLAELDRLASVGVTMIDTADELYPSNLHMVPDKPPFLFMRGKVELTDVRSISVVGSRVASERGLALSYELAKALGDQHVTVVSGLAAGIDTAAHHGALASGWRTIAVMGTGIKTIYPSENCSLASKIEEQGAYLSQFWPEQSGKRWTFPSRNIVTSGLSIGTVVIEAQQSSGAYRQAIAALGHGKRLLLLDHLVRLERWAEQLIGAPNVQVVCSVDQIVDALEAELSTDLSLG